MLKKIFILGIVLLFVGCVNYQNEDKIYNEFAIYVKYDDDKYDLVHVIRSSEDIISIKNKQVLNSFNNKIFYITFDQHGNFIECTSDNIRKIEEDHR